MLYIKYNGSGQYLKEILLVIRNISSFLLIVVPNPLFVRNRVCS